jgi:hypothetical protein
MTSIFFVFLFQFFFSLLTPKKKKKKKDWLRWLACGRDPLEFLAKRRRENVGACGRVWADNELAYFCEQCQVRVLTHPISPYHQHNKSSHNRVLVIVAFVKHVFKRVTILVTKCRPLWCLPVAAATVAMPSRGLPKAIVDAMRLISLPLLVTRCLRRFVPLCRSLVANSSTG